MGTVTSSVGEGMEIIVEFIKSFIKLCNKKDWSHLQERRIRKREDDWTRKILETKDYAVLGEEDIIGDDESEPVDINCDVHRSRERCSNCKRSSCIVEAGSEEFPSTEESRHLVIQKRKRRRGRKRLKESQRADQLLFVMDM